MKIMRTPAGFPPEVRMMLRHLDETAAADKAQKALETVYGERRSLTRDVGGTAGTTQFTEAVLAAMG